MGATRQFMASPLGRAVMVGLGFAIFLVTFIFWTNGWGVLVGSAVGLVIMMLPFGFGRDAAPQSEEPRTVGRESQRGSRRR